MKTRLAVVLVFLSLALYAAVNTFISLRAVSDSQKQLCGVLAQGLKPRPMPPTFAIDPDLQEPKTPIGRALLKFSDAQQQYNQGVAQEQADGVRELRILYKKYQCPEGVVKP